LVTQGSPWQPSGLNGYPRYRDGQTSLSDSPKPLMDSLIGVYKTPKWNRERTFPLRPIQVRATHTARAGRTTWPPESALGVQLLNPQFEDFQSLCDLSQRTRGPGVIVH
jgi:hypothetical protein